MTSYLRKPYAVLIFIGNVFVCIVALHVYQLWQARTAHANPVFEPWTQESNEQIDHSPWQQVLDTYLFKKNEQSEHTLFRYNDISDEHKWLLEDYIDRLQEVSPTTLNRDEQFAFWVNLYNAVTINLIIDHYPVDSIKKVGTFINLGPWDDVLVEIDGEEMTLNNIEHGVLRPIFRENRVHYVINCASLGCPNLQPQALTADNLEAQLEIAAEDFINHSKGVHFRGNELILSNIYDWFSADFGGDEAAVLEHINNYAKPQLKAKLNAFEGKIKYNYNWLLNDAANEQ